jgi:hypothetical protein
MRLLRVMSSRIGAFLLGARPSDILLAITLVGACMLEVYFVTSLMLVHGQVRRLNEAMAGLLGVSAGASILAKGMSAGLKRLMKMSEPEAVRLDRRAHRPEMLTRMLVGIASLLAGRRHAHLREAWGADLYDPGTGELRPVGRRLCLASGDVLAAVRCRLDDVVAQAWRPVDAVLRSWHGSLTAMLAPITTATVMIIAHESVYGLVSNAENLAVAATASYFAIKYLRSYRQIAPPKRPEKTNPEKPREGQPPSAPGR